MAPFLLLHLRWLSPNMVASGGVEDSNDEQGAEDVETLSLFPRGLGRGYLMPNVSEVIGGLLDNAIKNPRTTISGLLTALIGLIPSLLAANLIHGKAAAISLSIVTVSKIILSSFFQKDAGQVPAYVPGQAQPVMVPAHEIPNDPNAIPAPPRKP